MMKALARIVVAVFLVVALQGVVYGAELFVNKQGNDANNGSSREKAFLTIQKGVNALKPGDTLTIGPGEYFENVKRSDLGSDAADTVIRAEISGTALLRGDVPAPEFKEVDGYRFVYAASFGEKPQAVLEHDTLRVLGEKPTASELEFEPGFFYYDETEKVLYISRADLRSPQEGFYTLAVSKADGMVLADPKRVVIEGLVLTGFCPYWGISLSNPVSCVVRDCTCFMNVGGIVMGPEKDSPNLPSGSNNLIENCVCYGNNFAGIARYYADNDVIRNCYNYMNLNDGEHFGIMHYHSMHGPFLIENNISWGQNFDFSMKPPGKEMLKNCVALGGIRNGNDHVSHNLIGGDNEYDRGSQAPADSILFRREKDLNKDLEFADSLNLDFRLQPKSKFRNTAPDGSDRGPYQYEANIFYVSPSGNDRADGLSSSTPWRTLERAVRDLKPGDTLYLMKGSYAAVTWKNAAGAEKPINVRGRGHDPVSITGRMVMSGGTGVVFERLNFAAGMTLDGSSNTTLKNCTFSGTPEGLRVQSVKGLRVTHCLFNNAPLNIARSSGVFLAGNLYANSGKPAVQVDADNAILYSDYNDYKDASGCWQVAGATVALGDLQKKHDIYSLNIVPQIAAESDVPTLKNTTQFEGRGLHGTTSGVYHEYNAEGASLKLVGPFLHSTSDTTANIEWWVSATPTAYTLTWGETPEMKNTVDFRSGDIFNSFSLTDLKPGQTYYFNIQTVDPRSRGAEVAVSLPVLHPENARLTFKTAAGPADPLTYYVAPDGNDANTGLSRDQALRTANCAATKVGPGDTVLLYTGDYNETVRMRAAGAKDRPITFRAAPGEKPAFQADYLPRSVVMMFKPDYRFDGLYVRAQGFWGEGFKLRYCDRAQLTRCLNLTLSAWYCPETVVRNCVVRGGWTAVGLTQSPNSVVENNVFVGTILHQLGIDSPAIARNNIFCESIRNKVHISLNNWKLENLKESNNCFYVRWPENERAVVNDMTLPEYRAKTGSDVFAANPMMPGTFGFKRGWQGSRDNDFDEFFSTNPILILRDIGLQPEAFSDFRFEQKTWPYDRAWAEAAVKARNSADALVKAKKDREAMNAYNAMVAQMPMGERYKSDILEQAFLCAMRLEDYDRAMQQAKSIPVKVLSMKHQMEVFLARKQYAELLKEFSMDWRAIGWNYPYPELEDVWGDMLYYRSIAYAKTGDLASAERDLKGMDENKHGERYLSGEGIYDTAWLRLGDFYRQYMKDDNKALEAYMNVCRRDTWATWDTIKKPVLTGASDTLVKATQAACDILRKQGKNAEIQKLQADLKKAQEDAAAALRK